MNCQLPNNMSFYDYFSCAKQLMKMRTEQDEHGYTEYLKLIQTGNIEFFDYLNGFLTVVISHIIAPDNKHFVRINIESIDDGDMGAWSKEMSEEEAEQLAKYIAKDVFKDMIAFPTLEELNVQLQPYGMYITHE